MNASMTASYTRRSLLTVICEASIESLVAADAQSKRLCLDWRNEVSEALPLPTEPQSGRRWPMPPPWSDWLNTRPGRALRSAR